MTTEPTHPLCDEIQHWHGIIQLRYKHFLETITALELAQAQEALAIFSVLLSNNLGYVKQQIDMLDSNDAEALKIISADQLILRRTVAKIEASLGKLTDIAQDTPRALRSAMVDRLDIFIRLANILTNHHARIEEVIFPEIAKSITTEDGAQLAKELSNEMRWCGIESA